ncbi:hypothetical protein A6P54_15905 [Bacillus sp. MKU004]|nr:hypothetical protein A6P54_15905 [Bacillus sp. MKU004]
MRYVLNAIHSTQAVRNSLTLVDVLTVSTKNTVLNKNNNNEELEDEGSQSRLYARHIGWKGSRSLLFTA